MAAPSVSSWTLEDGLAVVRRLEAELAADLECHFALGGGVMLRGESEHDLDVIVYPHCSEGNIDVGKLRARLRALGWRLRGHVDMVHEEWRRRLGSADRKFVEIWATPERKRVDIIVPTVVYADEPEDDGEDDA